MIQIEESNPSFESCSDCVHYDDYEEICIFRRCIHAVAQLNECYVPKQPPEIVRCKDCKWFHDIGCAIRIVDDSDKPSENDYCSFAERRTDGVDTVQ